MPDGSGSRLLSLVGRPLGGVYGVFLILNDVVGLKAGEIRDTTRKHYRERLQQWKSSVNTTWVELPAHYAKQPIGEALELNRESGATVPREFQLYRQAIGDPVLPFERALVYQEISSGEIPLIQIFSSARRTC